MSTKTISPLPEAGQTYDGYQLVRKLGAGSFGAVYEARSPRFPGPIALKLSHEPVADEEVAMRALREISVMRMLTNDHVTHILDHGMGSDERWYLVMELLAGCELTDAHDFGRRMDPARAVEIVHQAAMGMEEAHRAGIVHRDLKPENLWIEPGGNVKVLDFGLARAWDAEGTIGSAVTIGHMLVGTPHYAQPEQVRTAHLTPASDVYSLGVILYEMLSGRTPLFPDERVDEVVKRLLADPLHWISAHANNPVVPLTRYPECQSLPPSLVRLVHRCLDKNPAKRPETAGELAIALADILHHDFGRVIAAKIGIWSDRGHAHRRTLVPGDHRVGFGDHCEIRLPEEEAHPRPADAPHLYAVLQWAGPPGRAEIRPLRDDGSVTIDGQPLREAAQVDPGTAIQIAGFTLKVAYPR